MAFGSGSTWGSIGTRGPARTSRVDVGSSTVAAPSWTGGGGSAAYTQAQQSSPFDQYIASNPQYLQYGNQLDRIATQIPFQGSYYDTLQSGQYADYQNALRGLDLQGQGNTIDRGANARDLAYIEAMKAQAGLERKNQGDINNNQLATGVRGINSNATSAGNWFSGARDTQINDAYKNWGTTNTGLDISYQRDLLGLDRQKGETEDRNRKLDLAAQQLGLDRDKLKTNLDQGLAQLGYDRFTNMNSLLDALDSTDTQRRNLASQIIQDAINAGVDFSSGAFGDRYASYNPYSNYQRPGQLNADRNG